ncbi:cell division protein FtsA [Candidatus Azambacteria bacterium RIFCSPLOWO2_01_FULL_46_25]|uniref:Cell division protein FtsA n=1 Tax=Candidatus Azambacteria bacterium RIFCSPLOWO2_01_FULL_46_25 TaxID=1797298 RepID=A0A1F5BU89_9BACT|nr:MAG: cell division protein FtsA [Candidatus Azambacteria bacterium RIFCSPLOWO2_01_FULL_46_25]OGD37741.1 MAG: cell division protein FtsA [Candidatus Azambacteria bacterium RIFCSPHIGHO2_01_FULL_51_74]
MAKDAIICALDIGSHTFRTVIAQKRKGNDKLSIIGLGEVASSGVRRGVLVDVEQAVGPLRESVELAEQASGYKVKSAYVSLSGSHISSRYAKGVISVSRADLEISQEDIERVIMQAQSISMPPNKETLYALAKEYIVDGEPGVQDPLGMHGQRLEASTLVIEGSTSMVRAVSKCMELLDVDIDGLVLAPVAAARAVLSRRQKELGAVCLDIGGGTSELAAFEEGSMIHTAVLPVGAAHITNDIAIGLRIDVDLAEVIKQKYGVCNPAAINKKELISISLPDGSETLENVSRREVAEIIEARMDELFELVEKELKKISRQALFPAGVVLSGGGARMNGITEFCKDRLKLPAHVGVPEGVDGIIDQIASPEYATAIGLCLWGNDALEQNGTSGMFPFMGAAGRASGSFLKRWLREFRP